jgi:cell division protein FtsA
MHLLTVEAPARSRKLCIASSAAIWNWPGSPARLCRGISALVEDEQELGAACIDMGGGSTRLSIFMKST